jgi:hypothetical protein
MLSAAAVPAGLLALPGCSAEASEAQRYDAAARKTWDYAEGPVDDRSGLRRELVWNATLAPSSHNTQCWKYRISESAISILPDWSRRCPAVDPDDHHLFVSLGCAAENIVQAAQSKRLSGEVLLQGPNPDVIEVTLDPTRVVQSTLADAIPQRQCTRSAFDGKALSNEELRQLEDAGTGNGVQVLLLTDRPSIENVLEYVLLGNTAQMKDQAFIDELKHWIRFSDDEAIRTSDGLSTRASGNASLPRWAGSRLFDLFVTAKGENRHYAELIRSSAGLAIFVSDVSDRAHWIEAGRCYQRFALQATALGIRNSLLYQPVEVAALRPQFAEALGIGSHRPDLVARFGRGSPMPRSLRRPLDAVLA